MLHEFYVAAAQVKFSLSGETAIRIDSYPAGGVSLTLTQAYFMMAARITFSTTPDQFSGPYSAAPPGTANLLGSGL